MIEKEIIRLCLDFTDADIAADTPFRTIDDWDSMTQINLVMALESKYGIKFTLSELGTLDCVRTCARIIVSKQN